VESTLVAWFYIQSPRIGVDRFVIAFQCEQGVSPVVFVLEEAFPILRRIGERGEQLMCLFETLYFEECARQSLLEIGITRVGGESRLECRY
jgi:hypothetical protein